MHKLFFKSPKYVGDLLHETHCGLSPWTHHCGLTRVWLKYNLFFLEKFIISLQGEKKLRKQTKVKIGNPNESKNNRGKKWALGKVLMFLFTGVRIEYYKAINVRGRSTEKASLEFSSSLFCAWPKKPPELRTWKLLSFVWNLNAINRNSWNSVFGCGTNLQFLCSNGWTWNVFVVSA